MSGTNPNYVAQIGPPAIMIEVFPRNECDGTQFSMFHCKRIQKTPSKVNHGYYSWPGKIESFVTTANFSALDIHYHNTPYLSALGCYTRNSLLIREVPDQSGGIDEGCNYLIFWV